MSPIDAPPTCPRCGAAMRLARVTPRAFGHPELRSFECRACREAVTLEVDK
jgi:transposase-like protein